MSSKKYPNALNHEHSPEAIVERLSGKKKNSFIRDFVYGAIDGAVTTFSIVAGVSGAELSSKVILILGVSNILADGFSMAASNYLGTKAEQDEMAMVKEFEKNQIRTNPKGETEEIRQIFKAKGFEGELLEKFVTIIINNKDQWVQTMLLEEYGMVSTSKSPWFAGAVTFLAFLLFGFIPLFPFIFNLKYDFLMASALTGVAFFVLGTFKSFWSLENAWISGLKTLFIGSVAAGLAYAIGVLLKNITGHSI